MNYSPIIFEGVSLEAIDSIRETLRQFGILVPEGNQGNISGEGFSGIYNWNEMEKTLTLQLISKPWFISYDMVKTVLNNAFREHVSA